MSLADQFLKNTLGETFLEDLAKSAELFKPGTRTSLDPEEIRIGLKVVPRVVMSFLINELASMEVNSSKVIPLPFGKDAYMNVNKGDRDSYSGSVFEDNKQLYDFMNRSIPGLGIILLSTFELYEIEELEKESKHHPDTEMLVQKLIDERLEQRALISKVIENKMSEREAVHKIIMSKLTHAVTAPVAHPVEAAPPHEPIMIQPSDIIKKEDKKKGSPLKEFLQRKKPKEYAIKMAKSETVDCPDCGQMIFTENGFSACICLGQDKDHQIWIKKSQDGVRISFSKDWDVDNMEMLLQILRRKNA